MPIKVFAFDQIKKFMGWCPNVRAAETRRNVSFENLESSVPERAEGENDDLKNPGWFRKVSTQILLVDTFFTLAYILIINQLGLNPIFLFIGFFVALFFIIFDWKAQMQRYDNLIKQPVIDQSDKKILYFILYASVYIALFYLDMKGWELALQAMVSFFGGFLLIMWLVYFQLLYWEKKNHKMIYSGKRYGIWKRSHIIRERK